MLSHLSDGASTLAFWSFTRPLIEVEQWPGYSLWLRMGVGRPLAASAPGAWCVEPASFPSHSLVHTCLRSHSMAWLPENWLGHRGKAFLRHSPLQLIEMDGLPWQCASYWPTSTPVRFHTVKVYSDIRSLTVTPFPSTLTLSAPHLYFLYQCSLASPSISTTVLYPLYFCLLLVSSLPMFNESIYGTWILNKETGSNLNVEYGIDLSSLFNIGLT